MKRACDRRLLNPGTIAPTVSSSDSSTNSISRRSRSGSSTGGRAWRRTAASERGGILRPRTWGSARPTRSRASPATHFFSSAATFPRLTWKWPEASPLRQLHDHPDDHGVHIDPSMMALDRHRICAAVPERLITEKLGGREQQIGSAERSREESTGAPEHPPHPAPKWMRGMTHTARLTRSA